jgi:predicted TIM-barrel fold metal-dependent hydrolase
MIVDFHVHPLFDVPPTNDPPPRPGKYGDVLDLVADPGASPYASYMTSQLYYGRNPVTLSMEDFITDMDEAGINKVVFQNAASKGALMRMINEGCAKLIQHYPERFIGFAGYDPSTGNQAVQNIIHAIEELGFKGIKTVSSGYELNINDEAYYPCYSKAQELGLPAVIHTGYAIIKGVRGKYVHPLMIDDVAFDFPDLKIVCAHLGGFQFMDVINMLIHHTNVYADLSFWPLIPHYVDLVPWELLEKTVPDKILLGSDYPFGQTPREAAETVKTLPIGKMFKEKILGRNAEKLLGL